MGGIASGWTTITCPVNCCMESLGPTREKKNARGSGTRTLSRGTFCGATSKELEAAAGDKSDRRSLHDPNSLHQFRGRPPSNTHSSLWTKPQSILYLNHKNGVPVPHLFQTLRFHTGFAEPPKNPCIITQYPVFGHKGHPPTFNLFKFGNN